MHRKRIRIRVEVAKIIFVARQWGYAERNSVKKMKEDAYIALYNKERKVSYYNGYNLYLSRLNIDANKKERGKRYKNCVRRRPSGASATIRLYPKDGRMRQKRKSLPTWSTVSENIHHRSDTGGGKGWAGSGGGLARVA